MRHLYFMLSVCLLPLTVAAQQTYHTTIKHPEGYVRSLQQRLNDVDEQLQQTGEESAVLFSGNEAFHVEQIINQARAGKVYYLDMMLDREQAFAQKLHQVLDTIWLRQAALTIRTLNEQEFIWQQAIDGNPLVKPSTFLAEAELIDVQPGEDILEIGAGDGAFSLALYQKAPEARYWVNELEEALLDPLAVRVDRHYATAPLRLIKGAVDRTGMPAQAADKVILRQVLHHLEQPAALLKGIRQTLRTKGQLFLLESYAESCTMCCSESWTQARIQAVLEQHDFQQIRAQAIPASSFYLTVWEVRPR